MSSGFFLTLAFSLCVSATFALPFGPARLSPAPENINDIRSTSNTTSPIPLPAHPVHCLDLRHPQELVPSDCSYILNDILLQGPDVFKERRFISISYETERGGYVRSRWSFRNCLIFVRGYGPRDQYLTFFHIALTANKILSECVNGVSDPTGGTSLIGNPDDKFGVTLRGFDRFLLSNISKQPAVSVSRRAIRSQNDSKKIGVSRGLEIREPLTGISRVSNHPVLASNSTLSPAAPRRYPVNCFHPMIIPLPPAAAVDCNFIIHQIILRLFDPTRQLTFGFTDAADVNLSNPEYRQWQYGQCMVLLKNNNVFQTDTFRMLDLAATASRINDKCVVNSEHKVGGVANIGTDGRGFYVYVGGPLASSPVLSDVVMPNASNGVESF